MFCGSCGAALQAGGKFCGGCGSPVGAAEVQQATPTASAQVAANTSQKGGDETGGAGSLLTLAIVVGLLAYGGYRWFGGSSPISTSSIITRDSSALDNLLVLGNGRVEAFDKLIDEGGLSKHKYWRGLLVYRLTPVFKPDGTLGAASVSFLGHAPMEVREALSPLCGVSPDGWKQIAPGTGWFFTSLEPNRQPMCSYQVQGDNDVHFLFGSYR